MMTYQDKDVTNKIIMYNRNANSIRSYFKYLNGHLRVQIMQVVVTYYGISQTRIRKVLSS